MEKLVCDRCGYECAGEASIDIAKRYQESWKILCERDGIEPRGIVPCPNISCQGELILKEV